MKPDLQEPLLKKSDIIRLASALILWGLTEGLKLLFKAHPDWFFPAFRRFSGGFMKVLASAASVVPFALWEYLICLGVLAAVVSLVWILIKKRRRILAWFTSLILIFAILFFYSAAVWSLNHYAPSLAEEMALEKEGFTEDELYQAALFYTGKAAEYASLQKRDENGRLDPSAMSFSEAAELAGRSYETLTGKYDIFSCGSVKPVKYVTVFDRLIMYTGTSGIFVEFTGESTVPSGNEMIDLPHTMCHEAAHRLGIASEEDANFAAFLACASSDNALFLYSGYYQAFVHLYNKLAEVKPGKVQSLTQALSGNEGAELLFGDAGYTAEAYAKYDTPVKDAGQKVNDISLKSYHVEQGVRSYGMVADDLIAWWKSNNQ